MSCLPFFELPAHPTTLAVDFCIMIVLLRVPVGATTARGSGLLGALNKPKCLALTEPSGAQATAIAHGLRL